MVDELYCAHYIVCNSFGIILQMKLNVKPFLNIIIVYYWGKINIFFNNTKLESFHAFNLALKIFHIKTLQHNFLKKSLFNLPLKLWIDYDIVYF